MSTDVRTAITVDVESESDAGNESEADAGVSASSVSHGVSDSSLRERMPLESDIGKLQFSGVDIKGLEDRYRLLITDRSTELSTYTSLSISGGSNLLS